MLTSGPSMSSRKKGTVSFCDQTRSNRDFDDVSLDDDSIELNQSVDR